MFAIAFDLTVAGIRRSFDGHVPAAYLEVERVLGLHNFTRIQGSVFVNQSESLLDVTNAMNALRGLPWFRGAVEDIRVFRIEQWSDFTGFHKAP